MGRAHHLGAWAYQLAPGLHDRTIGPAVDIGALRDVPEPAHDGTVFTPDPDSNTVHGGWRRHDHRLVGKSLALGAAGTGVLTATLALGRRLPGR